MKTRIVGLVIIACMYLLGSAQSPSMDMGKNAIEEMIAAQAKDRIDLIDFRKTDGLMAEVNAVKIYTMDFAMEIKFHENCIWLAGMPNQDASFVTVTHSGTGKSTDATFQATSNRGEPMSKGQRVSLVGNIRFIKKESGWTVTEVRLISGKLIDSPVMDSSTKQITDETEVASEKCFENLRNIGLGFRIWALDNHDKYPFNVSNAEGGTLEFCNRSNDGYENNPSRHFLVLSNEISVPRYLICPADSSKKIATTWDLRSENVSYQLRTGEKVDETNPAEILVRCPIHAYTILCDGTIPQKPIFPKRPAALIQPLSRHSKNTCILHLKQIEGAFEQWALEKKKSNGASTAGFESAIGEYIRGGIPSCPNGGAYTIGNVGDTPKCSLGATAGHTL